MAEDACEYLVVNQEKVDQIKSGIIPNALISKLADRFKLFSDPTRLKILLALEMEELCVCDIAALIGLAQPSVSHHLKSLRQMGIVEFRKSGKMTMYSLKDKRISGLLALARDLAGNHV